MAERDAAQTLIDRLPAAFASATCVTLPLRIPQDALFDRWLGRGEPEALFRARDGHLIYQRGRLQPLTTMASPEPHAMPRRDLGAAHGAAALWALPFEAGTQPPLAGGYTPRWQVRSDGRGTTLAVFVPTGHGREYVERVCQEALGPTRSATPRSAAPLGAPPLGAGSLELDESAVTDVVSRGLEALAKGLRKIVVSARAPVDLSPHFPSSATLRTMARTAPSDYLFAWRAGDDAFVGLSPERLLHLDSGLLQTEAMAGTQPMHGGAITEKLRLEHDLVDQGIAEAIQALPGAGGIERTVLGQRAYAEIAHWHRGLSLSVAPEVTVAEAVKRLHPTPAVGGLPRPDALAAIAMVEGQPRGLYAGPVGYVDSATQGEFAVALRCVTRRGSRAYLQAGAGLVPGSMLESEVAEIVTKLTTSAARLHIGHMPDRIAQVG